jgi:hypothetical protein
MRVAGDWRTTAQAQPAADRYSAHGYTVAIVEVRSERAGSHIFLHCIPKDDGPGRYHRQVAQGDCHEPL